MEQLKLNLFTVNGIGIRTNNRDEMDPPKAKIPGLWENFGKGLGAAKSPEVFGVYTHYESDEQGAYDLFATVKETFPGIGMGEGQSIYLTIPEGTYIKFTRSGPPKEACMGLWQEIWAYFQSPDSPRRAFVCDFEAYTGIDAISIYIGIEA